MKKAMYILCMFFLILTNFLVAQDYLTDKGHSFMSGSFAFSSAGGDLYENRDGDNLVIFQFGYSYAYFFSDGFAVGPKFFYASQSQGDASLSTVGIGAHATYFFGGQKSETVKGTFLPYLGLSFIYQSMSAGGISENSTGTIFSFGIGAMYMITETAALMTEFGYQMDSIESVSGNRINLTGGLAVFL